MSSLGIVVHPYMLQIDHLAEKTKREAEKASSVNWASTVNTKERPMRKVIYGLAAAAAAVALLIVAGVPQRPRTATALTMNQTSANDIVDVRALERSIDLKALPDGNIKGGYGEED